ncbi:hypothetical protein BRADI_1g57851v3 [Brachypodium distachyon]|uniref:Uncharacterized protein n=1 Tax=Brachypodium distachyon TaxID=15368 RepID=A0A2K2DS55_BRADI|nr:hypothetical protein BRADI_1g57851v3 [Brachypodium distachyon]
MDGLLVVGQGTGKVDQIAVNVSLLIGAFCGGMRSRADEGEMM